MNRTTAWLAAIIALAAFCWFLPPVHIVALQQRAQQQTEARFSATNFAAVFWQDKLQPALGNAADVNEMLSALSADPQKARERFGRKPGIGTTTLYFVRGTGRVVSVKKTKLLLALKDGDDAVDIILPTGLLFGNTLRDGTGLLDASTFPNSQDFNDLSTELNRIVETTVLPPLREQAAIGSRIAFTGCAEVDDEAADVRPLTVIPLAVQFASQK